MGHKLYLVIFQKQRKVNKRNIYPLSSIGSRLSYAALFNIYFESLICLQSNNFFHFSYILFESAGRSRCHLRSTEIKKKVTETCFKVIVYVTTYCFISIIVYLTINSNKQLYNPTKYH